MKNFLSKLIGKKFSVYVGGEFERMTDFIGFIKLLVDYSDFFQYTKLEQYHFFAHTVKESYAQIDSNIYVKVGK